MGSRRSELTEVMHCGCLGKVVPAEPSKWEARRPGPLCRCPTRHNPLQPPGGAPGTSPLPTFSIQLSPQHPSPYQHYCPAASRLLVCFVVKGVSGSQFSHNFSLGLQLLTRGSFPPTPYPLPVAAPPVSPAPTRKPPESTFQDRAAGNRHPDLSEPRTQWTLDGLGEGAQKEGQGGRICCQALPPSTVPRRTRAVPGANF